MTSAALTPNYDGTHCGRPKRQGEGTCTQPAGWGTGHVGDGACKLHGGTLPPAETAGRQRLLTRELRGMLKNMGTDDVTNPALELAKLAGEVVGWKDLLLTKVDELEALTTRNMEGTEQAKAVVTLLTAAFAESAKILTNMTRLGLDAAALGHVMAQPSREQAEVLSRVLDHVLAGLDLTGEQRGKVPAVLGEALAREGLV